MARQAIGAIVRYPEYPQAIKIAPRYLPVRNPVQEMTYAAGNPQPEPMDQSTIMNITISFTPEGTAQCLWTEALPLHELGRLEITRASNLEFNNSTQHWEVKDRRGKVRFIAKCRSACLEWEHQHLQP